MGRLRLLVVSTALHHSHRFRLQGLLPRLAARFRVEVVDVPLLGYDRGPGEPLGVFARRVVGSFMKPVRSLVEGVGGWAIRSPVPGGFGPLAGYPALRGLMARISRGYDAVLASPLLAGFMALHSPRGGAPLIYEDVDRFYGFYAGGPLEAPVKAMEYSTITGSDCVIAVSPHLYAEDKALRRGRETHLVPNGVDYQGFLEERLRAGRRRDRRRLVYVGAVEWWSGVELLAEAVEKASRRVPGLRLYVVGDAKTRYAAEAARRAPGRIVFLGRRPYSFVKKLLPRCRLGLLGFPSTRVTREAFPYKVLEYCAAGTPVVMTRVTALAGMVEEMGAGSVVEPGDADAMAEEIVRLVTDDDEWAEASTAADRLARLFDEERLAGIEAGIIERVAGG